MAVPEFNFKSKFKFIDFLVFIEIAATAFIIGYMIGDM